MDSEVHGMVMDALVIGKAAARGMDLAADHGLASVVAPGSADPGGKAAEIQELPVNQGVIFVVLKELNLL